MRFCYILYCSLLAICELLSESFYLKLAIICKNLFLSLVVVRLVIFFLFTHWYIPKIAIFQRPHPLPTHTFPISSIFSISPYIAYFLDITRITTVLHKALLPDITKYKCAWNVVESESSAISYNKVSLSDNILVSNLYYTATCNRKEYECQTYIGSFQANIGLFQHCNNLTISN